MLSFVNYFGIKDIKLHAANSINFYISHFIAGSDYFIFVIYCSRSQKLN